MIKQLIITMVAALVSTPYMNAVEIINGTSKEIILHDPTFISCKEPSFVIPLHPGQRFDDEDVASLRAKVKANNNQEWIFYNLQPSDTISFVEIDGTITIEKAATTFSTKTKGILSRRSKLALAAALAFGAGYYFKEDLDYYLRDAYFWLIRKI